jgi:acyl CoA:acetate/3-ketoacid CoA transferase alpha subunit
VKKILRYKLFFQAGSVGIVVLLLMLVAAHFSLNVITINTLTGTFFGGVFFTISIVFTGAMTDFKEAEKIPGEMAVILKAMHADAMLISPKEAERGQAQDIIFHIEGLHQLQPAG